MNDSPNNQHNQVAGNSLIQRPFDWQSDAKSIKSLSSNSYI